MKAVIYWKGMRNTIRSITKSCKTCQINKKWSLKYVQQRVRVQTTLWNIMRFIWHKA
jgi:hypothetical protein